MITNFKIFKNKNSKTILIVDIQPGHKNYISFDIYDFVEYLNKNKEKNILYLFNGTELGYDSEYDIKNWLIKYGLDDDIYIEFYEKTYGFFRDLIDTGIDDKYIIELGKYMIYNSLYSLNDIPDNYKLEFYKNNNIDLNEYSFFTIPYDIKEFLEDNIYKNEILELLGGGKDECLLEIKLLLNMMNINYNENYDFIY